MAGDITVRLKPTTKFIKRNIIQPIYHLVHADVCGSLQDGDIPLFPDRKNFITLEGKVFQNE
jgi:hypothetical protein